MDVSLHNRDGKIWDFEYDLTKLSASFVIKIRKKSHFFNIFWKKQPKKLRKYGLFVAVDVNLSWIERYFLAFIHKHERCVCLLRAAVCLSFLLCVLCIWRLRRVASCYCRCLWALLFIGRMLVVCACVCAIHEHWTLACESVSECANR